MGLRSDRGAGAIEYGAVGVLAGVIIGALYVSGLTTDLAAGTTRAVCELTGSTGCGESAASGDKEGPGDQDSPSDIVSIAGPGAGVKLVSLSSAVPPDGKGTDHDRRDAGREAGRDRENDEGRREDPAEPEKPSGDDASESGLGDPVPGETVPAPEPPPWKSPDKGAGEHGSDHWPVDDYFVKAAAETAAHAMAGTWPDASRNLLHFLGNSGDPLEQDVDRIMADIPGFKTRTEDLQNNLGQQAVEDAKNKGVTGPVTFPVNTKWDGFTADQGKEKNWFLASGSWTYNLTGEVTVYPPSEPGGQWRYETTTRVNWRDQYNWDGGKGTDIGPFHVSDESLADLHRAGVAQEYMMYGQSDPKTAKGTGR